MKGITLPITLINPANRTLFGEAFKAQNVDLMRMALQAYNSGLSYFTEVCLAAAAGRPAPPRTIMDPTTGQNRLVNPYTGAFIDTTLSQGDAFPSTDGKVVSVFFDQSEEPIDLTWLQLYSLEDFRNTMEESFEMWNVNNGMSFRVYENGEKLELFGVSGTKQTFDFQLVGSGFQWLVTWLNDNKHWRLANGMAEAATTYGRYQSETAFTVLAAGADVQVRATAGSTEVENDILTINAAKTQIMNDLRTNSGFVDPNPTFRLVYNNLEAGVADTRIGRIMNAKYGSANSTLGVIAMDAAISPLGSPNAPTGAMQLVYGGRKLKAAIRQDLTAYDDFDPYTYSGARAFWGRWVMVKGDGDQVRTIPYS